MSGLLQNVDLGAKPMRRDAALQLQSEGYTMSSALLSVLFICSRHHHRSWLTQVTKGVSGHMMTLSMPLMSQVNDTIMYAQVCRSADSRLIIGHTTPIDLTQSRYVWIGRLCE
jgi:hypothetical protein